MFLFPAGELYYCEHGGVDLMGLKPNPLDLSSFSALTLLVWSFDPKKPVPDMTYNVFGGDVKPFIYICNKGITQFCLPPTCYYVP